MEALLPALVIVEDGVLNLRVYLGPICTDFVSEKEVCNKTLTCFMKYRSLEIPLTGPEAF